ncbi:MAG: sodium-translocating pyrophosphatase [Actinomycetota bacterium]|nr:sodium-translocating pyrophosphatase [Actinomycetota bacterium]MDQ3719235.1 sodium-translocating pyrophosphatase [Actinomycetota bacterium]
MTDYGVIVALVCAGAAVVYGVLTSRWLLAKSPGNDEMQSLSLAIQEGASAYLTRQYQIIGIVAVVLAVLLAIALDVRTAIGFLIGGSFSAAAGFIGMNVSVRANARVAESARGGVAQALQVAFKGGAITGMLVAGLALLGVAGYYGALQLFDVDKKDSIDALIGLGFGGSLISVFARLGGGIFTKAADVGADIVGKIEAGIPEDDPRNPAVIADNVGDNVGDCAGMAADLFETYAVTAVAVMLLGVLTFNQLGEVAVYPLVIGGVSIIASIIGTYAVRSRAGNVERALYQGLIVSGVLAAAAFLPITLWLMDDVSVQSGASALLMGGAEGASGIDFWLCTLIGIGVTAGLFVITDYYTSTRFRPVRTTARASETGHATNIIQGLAQGFQSTALPAILIALGILLANKLGGIYGIGVAVMAQLSLTGLIVALDAFGPITDNAGGIAEMAELPEDVRNVTDPLDAVGNTTKAVTKGYAIGSAVLAALVLFAAFVEELNAEARTEGESVVTFDISQPEVLVGLLIGGMMVYLFAALSIESVGRAGGEVVEEVRRQFKEKPGIMDRSEKPDYKRAVSIVTKTAQREMILPALIPIVVTVIVGLLSAQALGGLLIGVIVVGFFAAVSMTAGGGAWDNAKKLIEDGEYGGKGSAAHEASITGDTVGDPYKDTAGPAINPMIKVANIVAILIIPFLV